jgi:beta-xylosidase
MFCIERRRSGSRHAAQGYRNALVRGMNPDPSVVRVDAERLFLDGLMSYF